MNNKLNLSIVALAVLVGWWWHRSSQTETHSQDFSAWSPRAAKPDPRREAASTPSSQQMWTATSTSRLNIDARVAGFKQGQDAAAADVTKGLAKGSLHEVAGRFFHPLAAFAVRADQSSAAMGTPLFEQNGYKIYSLDVKADPAWADLMVQTEGRPVVVKPNGTLGVVTGALVVKFNDMDKVAAVASAENLHVNLIDAKSSTAFFMAPPGYSLLPGIERLRALPGVERVEMEIDQSRKVGK